MDKRHAKPFRASGEDASPRWHDDEGLITTILGHSVKSFVSLKLATHADGKVKTE
ncbi:hypothetical protein [Sphingobium sp. AP50]|uniref:hypothetical protein n=1 Tax=Sphingobium sp. AP50 TaxID=1884369 RepID=UPI0015A57ED4|nr:hypothetical protein [Sphingobium sp. AP50]